MYHSIRPLASILLLIGIIACSKLEPESTVDPLPLPPEIDANKDLSVNPGDSFYDYCNGTWLQLNPIPASGSIGGLYDLDAVMEERVRQLRASVPDIGHFYDLMDHMHDQPEKSQAYLDEQKARFPKPTTKEEAFLTMGRMIADGFAPGESPAMRSFELTWKDGKQMGIIYPPLSIPITSNYINPEDLIPATQTKADDIWAHALVVEGMGLDLSQFVISEITWNWTLSAPRAYLGTAIGPRRKTLPTWEVSWPAWTPTRLSWRRRGISGRYTKTSSGNSTSVMRTSGASSTVMKSSTSSRTRTSIPMPACASMA